MNTTTKKGPLTGLKVLDLSRVLAGPWATQILSDYGAEVWKIEKPKSGDDTREWGESIVPEALVDDVEKLTAYYLSANRGKYSMTLDIKTSQGQNIIRHLAEKADILVENFKVGNLKKYGLDYQSLSKLNSKLVYCSITGFGQTGPFAEQTGYDAMIQASAGLMSITGESQGQPQKVGVAVSDLTTGIYAVTAILAAIYHRDKTGEGQHIDLALFDTQVAWLANQGIDYLTTQKIPKRLGSAHPSITPYQPMQCEDQAIMLAVGNNQQFIQCCKTMSLTHLIDDKRFTSNNLRTKNRSQLIEILAQKFSTMPAEHWLEELVKAKVPCGPINDLRQVFEHPQIKARGTCFALSHPRLGEIPQIANPVKFSKTPISYQKLAPSLGEDTENLLAEQLNFSESEIIELTQLGVI